MENSLRKGSFVFPVQIVLSKAPCNTGEREWLHLSVQSQYRSVNGLFLCQTKQPTLKVSIDDSKICEISESFGPYFEIFLLCTSLSSKSRVELVPFDMLSQIFSKCSNVKGSTKVTAISKTYNLTNLNTHDLIFQNSFLYTNDVMCHYPRNLGLKL